MSRTFYLAIQEGDDEDKQLCIEVPEAAVEKLRQGAVTKRDAALAEDFDAESAVCLSHVVALLGTALAGGTEEDLEATLSG